MKDILFQNYTREEIKEMANKGYAVVVPLAATEQHGPHLPVFTDSLICEHISTHAIKQAAAAIPLLMCPMLTIGCSSHHLAFGGTLSFSSSTYLRMLWDVGESLVKGGFRKIIFLNGHGGNESIMHQTVNDLAVKYPIWTAAASYWSVSKMALEAVNANEVGMVPGYAGGFETSAILALRKELVHVERAPSTHKERKWIHAGPSGTFLGRHKELTGYQGYTDVPHKASSEKGKLILDAISQSVAEWLINVYEAIEDGDMKIPSNQASNSLD